MDLSNLPNLFESCYALTHNNGFPWSIMDFLNGNWLGPASINDALVMTDQDKRAVVVEHAPVLNDKS